LKRKNFLNKKNNNNNNNNNIKINIKLYNIKIITTDLESNNNYKTNNYYMIIIIINFYLYLPTITPTNGSSILFFSRNKV